MGGVDREDEGVPVSHSETTSHLERRKEKTHIQRAVTRMMSRIQILRRKQLSEALMMESRKKGMLGL